MNFESLQMYHDLKLAIMLTKHMAHNPLCYIITNLSFAGTTTSTASIFSELHLMIHVCSRHLMKSPRRGALQLVMT